MPNLSKPHTVNLTAANRRTLVVPLAFAGCRVVVETDSGDTFAPLDVAADGTLELPCVPDADASRCTVRLAADRRAA